MLTDEQIEAIYTQKTGSLIDDSPWALVDFARAIEAAATEPLLQRIAEFVTALDEEMVVSHLGVFNLGDDTKKAIKDLMLWSQGVGEYFTGEKAKERIAELEKERDEWKHDALNGTNAQYLREKNAELKRQLEEALKDAERWKMTVEIGQDVLRHPDSRKIPASVAAYMDAIHKGYDMTYAVDATIDAAMKGQS